MIKEQFFQDLKDKVKPYFELGGSHSFDHVDRVYNLALKIAKGQDVDLDILKSAVLLHDVSRLKEDNGEVEDHSEHGAEVAKEILKEMKFPEDKIEKVCYAIKVHRHSKGIKAETKEAQILQDADRLDALGAITIGRMFSTGGKIGRPLYNPEIPFGEVHPGYYSESTLHGFYAKILKITPETFNTEKAKKIAIKRYSFVKKFLKQFQLEWEGRA